MPARANATEEEVNNFLASFEDNVTEEQVILQTREKISEKKKMLLQLSSLVTALGAPQAISRK